MSWSRFPKWSLCSHKMENDDLYKNLYGEAGDDDDEEEANEEIPNKEAPVVEVPVPYVQQQVELEVTNDESQELNEMLSRIPIVANPKSHPSVEKLLEDKNNHLEASNLPGMVEDEMEQDQEEDDDFLVVGPWVGNADEKEETDSQKVAGGFEGTKPVFQQETGLRPSQGMEKVKANSQTPMFRLC